MTQISKTHLSRGLVAILAWVLSLVAAAPVAAQAAQDEELKQQGYVNDFGDFIGEDATQRLEVLCRDLEEKTGDRLLIVTVGTAQTLTPGQFAEQLRNSWIADPDAREQTVILVVNSQGRPGLGIGSRLEDILTHEKLDAIMSSAFGTAGEDYDPKITAAAEKISAALQQGGTSGTAPGNRTKPATPRDLNPILVLSAIAMFFWLFVVGRAAGGGMWRAALLLQLVPCVALYLLNAWTGLAGGLNADTKFLMRFLVGGWIMGAFVAGLAFWKSRKRAEIAGQALGGFDQTAAALSSGASSPALEAAPGKLFTMRATPAGLSRYFLSVGLYGLLHCVTGLSKVSGGPESIGFLLSFAFACGFLYVSQNCERLLRERPAPIKGILYASSAICVLALLGSLLNDHPGWAMVYGLQLILNLALLRGVKRLAAEAKGSYSGALAPTA